MAKAPENYRLHLASPDGVHRVLSLCRRRRYELLALTYRAEDGTLELSIASERSRDERPGVVPALLFGLTGLVEVLAVEQLDPRPADPSDPPTAR